eukprot:TRINITY_DN48826_c0_g1_i1.p1 TRINITY_DN48826_c0_g1~~TRINITY_DN48826_c0_g1_i1.p1  ORF type:complete len:291 (-),score=45.72 TRINITY_DN48826_c0_g1_i1:45-863(-)
MFLPSRCAQKFESPSASTTRRPRRHCRLLFLQMALLLLLLRSTAFEDGTAQGFQSASRLAGPRRTPRRQQSTRMVRAASPAELYALGMTHIEAGRSEGVQFIREAAEGGNADAQCTLGTLHCLGMHGVSQDPGRAMEWLEKAIDGGSIMANYNLGVQCALGDGGFAVDKKRALKLFKVAADGGHTDSMMALATMFRNGDGVAQDAEQAAQWVMKAADKTGGYERTAREMEAGTLPKEVMEDIEQNMNVIREMEKTNPYLTKDDQGKKVVWEE